MRVLGIETSCDETAAAVVRGDEICSNIVSSQVALHRPYGGVVPELASRHHLQNIVPVVQRALDDAGVTLPELDGIAVTRGPGLVGALLVGVQLAKSLAYVHGLPLIGVNHLEGHLAAPRLAKGGATIPDRHLALLVSGGHTALVLVERFGVYRLLGATRDDAAGEAFDKVAKLLDLGYPGGPVIERLAEGGDPAAIAFPRALPRRDELDFSFSGLKTAVANYVRTHGAPSSAVLSGVPSSALANLCASFQQAVADVLVNKTLRAAQQRRVKAVVAGGGVLANRTLRSALFEACEARQLALFIPPLSLCTDNAAMIAAAGARRLMAGERSGTDLNAQARLPLDALDPPPPDPSSSRGGEAPV
ncbi:MAG: tRNA (adenosine(37)-N6)-threonylcarbamoyltransferase complex transferase subunit TsaD [Proteobacteria bacterium]|nr:MAG: tRNA (adenosine(37)-N6)-threonylcarbamoyltransferase complex transferase subunit TsaD [Pseudomonadota bacterium]